MDKDRPDPISWPGVVWIHDSKCDLVSSQENGISCKRYLADFRSARDWRVNGLLPSLEWQVSHKWSFNPKACPANEFNSLADGDFEGYPQTPV